MVVKKETSNGKATKKPMIVTSKVAEPLEKPSMAELKARLEQRKQKVSRREEEIPPPPAPITAGPVDKIVDVLVNPSSDKMLEVTDLDRNQVTLIPILSVIDDMWNYCQEVATYRYDSEAYKSVYKQERPASGNPIKKFVFVLAQCRRSLGGKTQKALEDLALADLETRNNDEGVDALGGHGFEE